MVGRLPDKVNSETKKGATYSAAPFSIQQHNSTVRLNHAIKQTILPTRHPGFQHA